jgi:hypothetical protein
MTFKKQAGGGYDIGASLSGSSSATSGASIGHNERSGDFIIGGSKFSPWILPLVILAVVVVVTLWIIRKH